MNGKRIRIILSMMYLACFATQARSNDFFDQSNVQYNVGETGGSPVTAGGVNVMNGNFSKAEQDIKIPTNGIPMAVSRAYNTKPSQVFENWTVKSGFWKIEKSSSSTNEMSGQGGRLLSAKQMADGNIELDIKTVAGNESRVNIHYQDDQNYYYLSLDINGNCSIVKYKNGIQSVLATKALGASCSSNVWRHVKISISRGWLQVYVAGAAALDIYDNSPIAYGFVGLEANGGSHVHFDNVTYGRPQESYTDNFTESAIARVTSGDWWCDSQNGNGCLIGNNGNVYLDVPCYDYPTTDRTKIDISVRMRTMSAGSNLNDVATIDILSQLPYGGQAAWLYIDKNNMLQLWYRPAYLSPICLLNVPAGCDYRQWNKVHVISTLTGTTRTYKVWVNDILVGDINTYDLGSGQDKIVDSYIVQAKYGLHTGYGVACFDDISVITTDPYHEGQPIINCQEAFSPGYTIWHPDSGYWSRDSFGGGYGFPESSGCGLVYSGGVYDNTTISVDMTSYGYYAPPAQYDSVSRIRFRWKDDNNYYYFVIYRDNHSGFNRIEAHKVKNGTDSVLASKWTTYSPDNFNRVKIQMKDNHYTIWVNSNQELSAADMDSAYPSYGRIVFEAHNSYARFNVFQVQTDAVTIVSDDFETGGYIGYFGRGWTSTLDERIVEMFNSAAAVHYTGNGGVDVFLLKNGAYTPPLWVYEQLTKNTSGCFQLTGKNGTVLCFDNASGKGKLLSVTDRNGNVLKYSYANNIPTGVTEWLQGGTIQGRSLSITTVNGLVTGITDPLGRTFRYRYDADKNLTSVVDFMGSTKTYSYQTPDFNLISYTDYEGNIVATNTYSIDGKIASQADFGLNSILFSYGLNSTNATPYGPGNPKTHGGPVIPAPVGTWIYQFDSSNTIQQITYPDNTAERFIWDEAKNLTALIDKNGFLTRYTYDSKGNMLSKTDSSTQTIRYTYEPIFNKVLTITDALGNTTTTQYDVKGNPVSVRDPMGNVTLFTYDGCGNILSKTDSLGRITRYTYDVSGYPSSIINPLNIATGYHYDAVGRKMYETYANGGYTTFAYDANDNTLSVTDALNNRVLNTYDKNNRLASTRDARGNTTSYQYDYAGNTAWTMDALGNVRSSAFDMGKNLLNGRRDKISDTTPDNRRSYYYYDALSRLVMTMDPLGNATTNQYDNAGNLIKLTDAENHSILNTYDNLNRLVSVTDPVGNVVRCTYDANNNKTSIIDANGHTSINMYDKLNRIQYEIDPLGNVTQYTYDSVGNVASKTVPNGGAVQYTYDALNRLTQVTYPNSTSVAYTYDNMGNRTSMTDSLGQTTYTYDVLNRLTRSVAPGNIAVSYTYDANGNRASMTTPLSVTTYGYDALNRSTGIVDGSYVTKYSYDTAGRRSQATYPSGAKAVYGYDGLDRLVSLQNLKSNGTIISSFTYTYDKAGNKLTQLDKNGLTSYAYDAVYRLTGAQYPAVAGSSSAVVSFTYDNNGNRTGMTYNTITTTYTYDAGDRLVGESGGIVYRYDNNGNLSRQLQNGATVCSYYYDGKNMLTQVNYSTYTAVQYAYNGDGQRIYKQTPSKLWKYYYDLTELFGATSGNIIERYVNGPNTSEMNYCIRTENGASDGWIFHKDGMGSIVNLTDASQNVTGSYVYDAFGTVRSQTGTKPNRFLYCGKEYDPEIGLYNSRARMYSSRWGRFINQDPAGSGSNLYIYASNNPMLYTDPTGLYDLIGRLCDEVGGSFSSRFDDSDYPMLGSDTGFGYFDNVYDYVQHEQMLRKYLRGETSSRSLPKYQPYPQRIYPASIESIADLTTPKDETISIKYNIPVTCTPLWPRFGGIGVTMRYMNEEEKNRNPFYIGTIPSMMGIGGPKYIIPKETLLDGCGWDEGVNYSPGSGDRLLIILRRIWNKTTRHENLLEIEIPSAVTGIKG